jgi:hypothetical protein
MVCRESLKVDEILRLNNGGLGGMGVWASAWTVSRFTIAFQRITVERGFSSCISLRLRDGEFRCAKTQLNASETREFNSSGSGLFRLHAAIESRKSFMICREDVETTRTEAS